LRIRSHCNEPLDTTATQPVGGLGKLERVVREMTLKMLNVLLPNAFS
jgi:hypothetical protein